MRNKYRLVVVYVNQIKNFCLECGKQKCEMNYNNNFLKILKNTEKNK